MTDVTRILSPDRNGRLRRSPSSCCPSSMASCGDWRHRDWRRRGLGQTLQATVLVHEAYLRLVDGSKVHHWNSRGHFFGAAAEAMRRILVEQARRKGSWKAGGRMTRIELSIADPEVLRPQIDLVALDEGSIGSNHRLACG